MTKSKNVRGENPFTGKTRQELLAAGYSLNEVKSWLEFQLQSIEKMISHQQRALKQIQNEEKSVQHDQGKRSAV